jgi:glutamate carboxypeptidase
MNSTISFLNSQLQNFVDDLAELVNLDCGTHNKAGVDRAGAIMRRHLEDRGFVVEALPLREFGDCLVGRLSGQGDARIMLMGHLDTVYPDGTAAARPMRIEGAAEAERILGPGVCDMKGGLLAGLYAVSALQAVGFEDFAEIVFFCNSDEEVGSPASKDLFAGPAREADAALVLEPARANGDIVSARKGGGDYHIKVTGRSAHAGVEPEKGANAIIELTQHLQAIHQLNGIRPGVTVNVGVISGGTRSNVVPDQAAAEIDVRVARAEDISVLDAAVREAASTAHIAGTTTEISGGVRTPPMERTAAIAFLADLAHKLAAELGFSMNDVFTGGVSDANVIAGLGTPVLDGLGPIGGLDHSPDEYLDRPSIVPRTALVAGLIRAIAAERSTIVAFKEAVGDRNHQ